MGLSSNLLFFWKNRDKVKVISKAVDNVKEAYKMETVKPGYRSTEFWMTVLTNVVVVVGALQGVLNEQPAAIIVAVANGLYGVLRAATKKV